MTLKDRYRKLAKLWNLSSQTMNEFGFLYFVRVAYFELKKNGLGVFSPELPPSVQHTYSELLFYNIWLNKYQIKSEQTILKIKNREPFQKDIKISIIITASENNKQYLKQTLISIIEQIYENWEVIIYHPNSMSEMVDKVTKSLSDSGITGKIKSGDMHSLNEAIKSTSGGYVGFINSGNILPRDILFMLVDLLHNTNDVNIIYFDEDQIDEQDNRIKPFFKPDWSPELFLSVDYISEFYVVRKELLDKCQGFREQFKSAKHFDLLLRLTETTKAINHIPIIGISVRISNSIRLSLNNEDCILAIQDALSRRNIKGQVSTGPFPNTFRIKYFLEKKPLISIIIPTKDQKDLLKRCITSIQKNTSYKNYEIIIVDNNSTKEETISYLNSLPYKIIKYNLPFNFSKINNLAATYSSGEYLLFLNDDVAALESDWLTEMISICQQEKIGIVGAKLVLSSNVIQHAGLTLLQTGSGFHPLQGVDADGAGYFGFLNLIRNFSAVTGACLLIRRKVFEKIGGFDEKFDLYYGDVDLCMKVVELEFRVVYTPYAKLLHQGSSSIKEQTRSFFAVENHQEFVKKWPSIKNGDPFYNPNLTWDYKININ